MDDRCCDRAVLARRAMLPRDGHPRAGLEWYDGEQAYSFAGNVDNESGEFSVCLNTFYTTLRQEISGNLSQKRNPVPGISILL